MKKLTYKEIESVDALRSALTEEHQLRHYAFQNIDFSKVAEAANCSYTDCIFMGCDLSEQMMAQIDTNCYVFSSLPKPYTIFPVADVLRRDTLSGLRSQVREEFS
jgi:hypothetical protein